MENVMLWNLQLKFLFNNSGWKQHFVMSSPIKTWFITVFDLSCCTWHQSSCPCWFNATRYCFCNERIMWCGASYNVVRPCPISAQAYTVYIVMETSFLFTYGSHVEPFWIPMRHVILPSPNKTGLPMWRTRGVLTSTSGRPDCSSPQGWRKP